MCFSKIPWKYNTCGSEVLNAIDKLTSDFRTPYFGGPGSIVGIATGYGLDGPGIESRWGARFSAPVPTGPGAHPASCAMGTGSFPGVKSGRSVTLTPHPLLVPRSRKGRAIPLLPLWAVQPVQSLSACTRVTFTFFIPYFMPYKKQFPTLKMAPKSPCKKYLPNNRMYLITCNVL